MARIEIDKGSDWSIDGSNLGLIDWLPIRLESNELSTIDTEGCMNKSDWLDWTESIDARMNDKEMIDE